MFNFSFREENVHVPLPLFMDEELSEERQLMKWAGIFQVGILRGKGGGVRILHGGGLISGNFSGGVGVFS